MCSLLIDSNNHSLDGYILRMIDFLDAELPRFSTNYSMAIKIIEIFVSKKSFVEGEDLVRCIEPTCITWQD